VFFEIRIYPSQFHAVKDVHVSRSLERGLARVDYV